MLRSLMSKVLKIQRNLKQNNNQTNSKPVNTLSHFLNHGKKTMLKKRRLVLSAPCLVSDSDTLYLGETKRCIGTSVRKHKSSVRHQKIIILLQPNMCNPLATKLNGDAINEKEQIWHQRKWAEARHIAKKKKKKITFYLKETL